MNTTPFSTLHFTSTPETGQPGTEENPAPIGGTDQVHVPGERALVLGGGGSAGNAWLIGVITGLFDAGLDVTGADLIIGTSAGATAAAQITGASPAQLFADILAATPPPRTRPGGSATGAVPNPGAVPNREVVSQLEATGAIIASARGAADMRRRMGAWALEADEASDGSWSSRWRTTVAARLPSQQWPDRRVVITAVDARTGGPVVFDCDSGVDLADAVAASCASGMPYGIGENRFIDGGYRRNENADLAAGSGRVLVLSPLGGRTRHPLEWGLQLQAQVRELRAGGSKVETMGPDSASLTAFGTNLMDQSTRPAAARAGYNQGRALAGQITGFWRQHR